MKNLILLLVIILATATSCERITYAYKFSYKLNTVHPGTGQHFTLEVTSFYPCGNILTDEEEICLLVQMTNNALERDPMGFAHKLEMIEDHEFNDRKEYHCP